MWTVGTLFVVFLVMSPKEEPTLQKLFKPHVPQVVHHAMSQADLRKYGVTVGCLFMGRQSNFTRISVGQGLQSNWRATLSLQVHKRRRDAELEAEEAWVQVV